MFKAIVTKKSIRKAIGKKKLPPSILLHVPGSVLLEIFAENGLPDYELMNLTYCFNYRSISQRRGVISGSFSLRRKTEFNLERMTRLVDNSLAMRRRLQEAENSGLFKHYTKAEMLNLVFRKYVRGDPNMERRYRNV